MKEQNLLVEKEFFTTIAQQVAKFSYESVKVPFDVVLPKMVHLVLVGTLSELHRPISLCIHLQRLILQLKEPVIIEQALVFPNLKYLKIRGLKTSSDAAESWFFNTLPSSLETLSLYYASLFDFPKISHLQHLSELICSSIQFKQCNQVPLWIQPLTKLQEMTLQVSDQKIPAIPYLPCNLKRLKTNCILSHIQATITQFDCSGSQLNVKLIQKNSKLKHLCASFESEMDGSFPYAMLSKLQVLDIYGGISSLDGLLLLQHLTELYLNFCSLTIFPSECAELPCLKILQLKQNRIQCLDAHWFDEDAGYFPVLQHMTLAGNALQEYPDSINLSRLASLELHVEELDEDDSPLVEPAQVDRVFWSTFALQHMKKAYDHEESMHVHKAKVTAAIPCEQDWLYLYVHMGAETYQCKSFSQVVLLRVHVPSLHCELAVPCFGISSMYC